MNIIHFLKLYSYILIVGHGFKLAPVVGKVLAELATNQTPSYDMTPFRIQRFRQNSKL